MLDAENPDGTERTRIVLADAEFMKSRWDDVLSALNSAFADSVFNDAGYTADNPVAFTRAGVDGKLGPGMKHVLALGTREAVVGGWFCIPTARTTDATECDAGWIFVVPGMERAARRQLVDRIVEMGFQTMRDAGFRYVVSNMGTPAGAKSMSRYGFVHQPIEGKQNRWTKQL
ncbi:hypothetical protein [Kitasatospora sp. NPDC059673]|uniref:hypothetical protein n=1 Tax=Kitasatospora sp. NPDC059673 TaxID=3346901 RepID=UPI0036D0B3A3